MNKLSLYFDQFLTLVVSELNRGIRLVKQCTSGRTTFSIKEQILFLKRLSMMLRSGMPIAVCLEMLEQESYTLSQKTIMGHLRHEVSSGKTLAQAWGLYKRHVGQFMINLVRIGESSGTLASTLEYIALELKKKHELRKQIIGALIYPLIIITATLSITVFLIVYIFPKILPIFQSMNVDLPFSTRLLIQVSGFLRAEGFWVFLLLLLVGIAYPFIRQTNFGRYYTDVTALRLPLFGRLTRYYYLANQCRTLGLLLLSEVHILEAIEITADSTEHLVYRNALQNARNALISGKMLSTELRLYPDLYPILLVQMVQAGEMTGNLSNALMYISDMYESDITDVTKNLTTLLEPLLMLCMGLCVGFIAISIITPIYGLTQHLHA